MYIKKYIPVVCLSILLQAQQLQKIYVHTSPAESLEQTAQLELVQLVFYFSKKPVMQRIEDQATVKKGWVRESYLFALDDVHAMCKQALSDMQIRSDHYHITCTEVASPIKGIRLDISYNAQCLTVLLESFDAITGHKGVIARVLTKNVLDRRIPTKSQNNSVRIVIDPGHGGKDPGAIGINRIAEKDVTLQVGLLLADLLRQKGCTVFMTRDTDIYVSLQARTYCIRQCKPNAYISIHANSSSDSAVQGIETYCARRNLFSCSAGHKATGALFDQIVDPYDIQSSRLAHAVQTELVHKLRAYAVHDRTVKYAVSQLLLCSHVPGILVEVGFVTHPQEADRLAQANYQKELAHALCDGLLACL